MQIIEVTFVFGAYVVSWHVSNQLLIVCDTCMHAEHPQEAQTCHDPGGVCFLQVNGHPIPAFKVFGKPHPEPYRLMEGLLLQQAQLIGLDLPKAGGKLPFGAVYAVGDNPASDIAGATAAGTCLPLILVPCSSKTFCCLL